MKIGVITDGISRDFEHALKVMDEFGLEYAELQFVWDKEIGFLETAEVSRAKKLLKQYGKQVSNICHHIFAGMRMTSKPGDELHTQHMDRLKRCMEIAHELGSPRVRILSPKKEQVLFGANGAEKWNVAKGAWDALPPLISPAVELAKKEKLQLVIETGNGTMINSSWTARKLIGDLDAGFAAAGIIVERTYKTKPVHQGYIEPHACTATVNEGGQATVWCCTQGHFEFRATTAKILNPANGQQLQLRK